MIHCVRSQATVWVGPCHVSWDPLDPESGNRVLLILAHQLGEPGRSIHSIFIRDGHIRGG